MDGRYLVRAEEITICGGCSTAMPAAWPAAIGVFPLYLRSAGTGQLEMSLP